MCSSIQNTFAWLGFLLVSAGFISLTAYGAVKLWPLGFGVCGLYTALLFLLANRAAVAGGGGDSDVVVRDGGHSNTSEQYNVVPGADDDAVPIAEQRQQQSPVYNYPIYANLLYALGVVGLAVTGLFLPFNLLPCSHRSDSSVATATWTTNLTKLPEGVRPWASNSNGHYYPYQLAAKKSFSHIQNTTLFRGTMDVDDELIFSSQTLWAVHNLGLPPQEYAQYNPNFFVDVGASTVCFAQSKVPAIVCSGDGETFSYPTNVSTVDGGVYDFFVRYELLWFKESPSIYDGTKIYSLNVVDMNLTCYSELVDPSSGSHNHHGENKNCSQEKTNRELGLGILLASGLPMLAVSIVLWRKKHVPSMGLISYLAASLCYGAILAIVRPNVDQWDHLWQYWLAIAGFLVMAILAYALLVITEVGSVLAWGLNTGGFSFMLGMSWLLLEGDLFWRWFLLNLLCFFPLVFLGAVTRSVFLQFLGAFGFLMDAGRFAEFLADHIRADESFLVVFFVLACSGCAIACAGLMLNRYQEYLRAETIACLQSFQSWIRRHGVSNTEIDESLLLVDDELAVSSAPAEADGRNFE